MNEKFKLAPLGRLILTLGIIVFIVSVISSCVQFKTINQPSAARTGNVFTTTVTAIHHYGAIGSVAVDKPYFGIHLPHNWKVIPPITYTGSYTGSIIYDETLSGNVENIVSKPGYFWWVGAGEKHIPAFAGQVSTATVAIETGNQAGIYYLDYMTGASSGGHIYDLRENISITVTADYGAGWQVNPSPTFALSRTTMLTIPVTLTNLGDVTSDNFELSITPPSGWQADFRTSYPITHTTPLTFLESLPLTIQLTIPPDTLPGTNSIPITATSTATPAAKVSAFVDVTILSGQHGYGLSEENNTIGQIDPVINKTIGLIDVSAYGTNPSALALSPNNPHLYISLYDSLLVINTDTHLPVASLTTAGFKPGVIAFICDGSKALVANKSSAGLVVVDTKTLAIEKMIYNLPGYAREIATSNCGSDIALVSNGEDYVTVVDTRRMQIVKNISGFHSPSDVVITPNSKYAYVANNDNETIGVIDLANLTLLENIDFGNDNVNQLAISPDGRTLYVGDVDRLLVIEDYTYHINLPYGYGTISDIEVSPGGEQIYVSHGNGFPSQATSVVSVINAASRQIEKTVLLEGRIDSFALYTPTCPCKQTYLPIVVK